MKPTKSSQPQTPAQRLDTHVEQALELDIIEDLQLTSALDAQLAWHTMVPQPVTNVRYDEDESWRERLAHARGSLARAQLHLDRVRS